MSVTAIQVQRVGAGAGDTASCQVIATAINDASGIEPDVLTANSVLYAVTTATPAALAVAASRIVGRKASGNIAALTGTEVVALLPVATNAVAGAATAAQITALENSQKGLGSTETIVTGAVSVATASTFLEPTAPTTYTFAAGTKGQRKTIMLNAAFAATLPGPVVLTVIGDNLDLLYNGSDWQVISSTITP